MSTTTLAETFSKKAQRQRTVQIMKIKDSHLDPLYEWCLENLEEESHPFLPLALSLTYGRLISAFLLRQSSADASSSTNTNTITTAARPYNKKEREFSVATKESRNGANPPSSLSSPSSSEQSSPALLLEPSIADDPSVSSEDRIGTLLRVDNLHTKMPRLQLTSKVAHSLQGLVNDLVTVLKLIKDKTEDTIAMTTVLDKARILLPDAKDKKADIFGRLLMQGEGEMSGDESKQKSVQKLFIVYAGLALGWAAEKLRRATEAYHDFMWLCDQVIQPITPDEKAREICWKGAVTWKKVAQNQDVNQTYASRRYALLAACASVGLWKCREIVRKRTAQSEATGKETQNNPPPAKRMRLDKSSSTSLSLSPYKQEDPHLGAVLALVKELVDAAGKEAAFTRWIGGGGGRSCGRWKIAADIKTREIQQAMLSYSHFLLVVANDVTTKGKQVTPRVVDDKMWWQSLSVALGQLPERDEWDSLVDELYTRQLNHHQNSGKTFAQNIQSFHEQGLLDYERQIERDTDRPTVLLVDKVVWNRPVGSDPLTTAIVSNGKIPVDPVKAEQQASDPSLELLRRRASIPALYNEGMELNEWAVSLFYLDDVEPTAELVQLLEKALPGKKSSWKDLMPKVVNKSLLLLLQESLTANVGRKASVAINSLGTVTVTGEMTHDKAVCRAIIALFYHALESILSQETEDSVKDEIFLRSILTCCMTCVIHAAGLTHKIHPKSRDIPVYSFLQMTESTPMSFLHYAPVFRFSLSNPDNPSQFPLPRGLPKRIHREFYQSEMAVLDSILWAKDPTFEDVLPDRADDLIEATDSKCCWWPVKVLVDETEDGAQNINYPSAKEDAYYLQIYHNLSVLMARTLEISHARMESVCRALDVPHWRLLLKYAWQTFRYFLRQHVKLFYDRHIDHWILTTIYGVSKRMKFDPEITFARTIDAYIDVRGPELGEAQCHRIVRQVKVGACEGSSQLGHIILLYNKVFIPAMRTHLLSSEDLKEATERLSKAVQRYETSMNLPKITPTHRFGNQFTSAGEAGSGDVMQQDEAHE